MLRASITKDTQHIKVMNNNKSLLALVLFPFAPFLSFLTACTNLRNRANGIVFVLFYSLFGYCHTFNDVRSDSYRKAEIFKYYFSVVGKTCTYVNTCSMTYFMFYKFINALQKLQPTSGCSITHKCGELHKN